MYVYSVFLQVILLFNCLKTIQQRINSQVIWYNQCKLVFFNASIPDVRGLIHEYVCVCLEVFAYSLDGQYVFSNCPRHYNLSNQKALMKNWFTVFKTD